MQVDGEVWLTFQEQQVNRMWEQDQYQWKWKEEDQWNKEYQKQEKKEILGEVGTTLTKSGW